MVDAWIGYLLKTVENMGLMEKTAIIFTSDHGIYFGEHGGLFGKFNFAKLPDGTAWAHGPGPVPDWDYSPLYDEVALLPLLIYVPGEKPGVYGGLTSAVDIMPTVLEFMGQQVPDWVEGDSLLPRVHDLSLPGRGFTVTTIPFGNPGEPTHPIDQIRGRLARPPVTTITVDDWSLLYSEDEGLSELYHLPSDPSQRKNVISDNAEVAHEIHQHLVNFMRETNLPEQLLKPRLELKA